MAQFTSVSYSGSYSGSGQGSDPIYGSYTVVASGTLTAILSQDVAGNVSGTWSYSGSTTSTGSFGSETTPVSDSGDVSGTAASLSFTSNHGVFVNGIGQLTNGDTLITASATFVFDGGSGGASGSMTGYPPAEAQVITGTEGNDILTGGAGNDTLDGGAGIDAASYIGNRASFPVTQTGTSFTVANGTGTEGTDTITDIERIVFADAKIALDVPAATRARLPRYWASRWARRTRQTRHIWALSWVILTAARATQI